MAIFRKQGKLATQKFRNY